MELVIVVGADGRERELALLERTERAVFVCPKEKHADIVAGRAPRPMAGFPVEDVRPVGSSSPYLSQGTLTPG